MMADPGASRERSEEGACFDGAKLLQSTKEPVSELAPGAPLLAPGSATRAGASVGAGRGNGGGGRGLEASRAYG